MALATFSRGTKAKLDATKKTDGRIYVTTDTGNMYVDVGNETDSSAQRFLIGADGIKAASDAVASAKSYTDTVAAGKAAVGHKHAMADVTGLQAALDAIAEGVYPVGSLYLNATDATNPHDLLGFGTWAAFGQGRMLLSASDAHEAGATGGSETVALTAEQMPGHTHTATTSSAGAHTHTSWYVGMFSNNDTNYGNSHLDKKWNSVGNGGTTERYGRASLTAPSAGGHNHTLTTASAGGGKAHNNMPPYITVYMWVRTA